MESLEVGMEVLEEAEKMVFEAVVAEGMETEKVVHQGKTTKSSIQAYIHFQFLPWHSPVWHFRHQKHLVFLLLDESRREM